METSVFHGRRLTPRFYSLWIEFALTEQKATSAQPKPAPPAAATAETPVAATPAVASTPAAPSKQPEGEAATTATPAAPMDTETPAVTPVTTEANAASNLVSGSAAEDTIKSMMEMGFPREDCQRALRAAFNNPERAVEYLMTGIPDTMEPPQAPVPAAAPAATTPAAGAEAGGPNVRPLDMFNPAANVGTGGADGGALQFLRDHPQFQTLKAMMASNPALLQPMLQELGKQNPELLQLINANQEEFYSILHEPSDEMDDAMAALGEMGGAQGPGAMQIEISPEDNEAIERLTTLGFTREIAAQAFFACEKNEQLAANYLFDHGHELMDQ